MQSYSRLEKQDKKLYENPTNYTKERDNYVKCKCGHSVDFWHGEDKVLCSWCGTYVFKDEIAAFKYRMTQQLNKNVRRRNHT